MMPIRWGILGCGDVAEHKSGPALMQATGSSVVAVMRRDGAKAADFARRHGIPRWYDDAEALLADPEVNAVYIATPPSSHADLTIRAARAGKRVLVEKPMARTVAECEAMIAACGAAGVPLHVAYYRRFYPKFQAAKAVIDSGRIGQPISVTLQMATPKGPPSSDWRLQPQFSGGGLFFDVGVHRMDMILFLLGELTDVSGCAVGVNPATPVEDNVAFTFRCASSGALGTVSCQFEVTPQQRDRLEIAGSEAILLFDPFDGSSFTVQSADSSVETRTRPAPAPVHLPFVEALIASYNGDAVPGLPTGLDGLQINRIVAQAAGTMVMK